LERETGDRQAPEEVMQPPEIRDHKVRGSVDGGRVVAPEETG
jgi:hypothetical protein